MDSGVVLGICGFNPEESGLVGEVFVVLDEERDVVVGGVGQGLGIVGPLLAMCDFVDDEGFLPEGDEVWGDEFKGLKELRGSGFGYSQDTVGGLSVPVGMEGGVWGIGGV